MKQAFIDAVYRTFNPHTPMSGTESVGPLLYGLVRMGRYETVAEFGTGFTTPFLAQALADNHHDYLAHRQTLVERVAKHRDELTELLTHELVKSAEPDPRTLEFVTQSLGPIIFSDGDPPVTPNPFFYRHSYEPQLFAWEAHPESHDYVKGLRTLLKELRLESYVTLAADAEIDGYMNAIPPRRRPVGMAWNDCGNKVKFFNETYPHVSSEGGLVAFHSPENFQTELSDIKKRLADQVLNGACEFFTLVEPHKVTQNSCFLIRKCESQPKNPLIAFKEAVESLLALSVNS